MDATQTQLVLNRLYDQLKVAQLELASLPARTASATLDTRRKYQDREDYVRELEQQIVLVENARRATADRLYMANLELTGLMDNDAADEASDYWVVCGDADCSGQIPQDDYNDQDAMCKSCYDSVHFDCIGCDETLHCDEESDDFKGYCVECGCARNREIADGIWSEIEDLAGSWAEEDGEIAKLRKVLSYMKRLKK
jgi:hypothetical protein